MIAGYHKVDRDLLKDRHGSGISSVIAAAIYLAFAIGCGIRCTYLKLNVKDDNQFVIDEDDSFDK
jgi:hypothetical protein